MSYALNIIYMSNRHKNCDVLKHKLAKYLEKNMGNQAKLKITLSI